MTDSNERIAAILDDYLDARRRGEAVERADLLSRHPELAQELSECLDTLELCERGFVDGSDDGDEAIPGTIGDFKIAREIGRGGMGVVYEAEQISLKRRVALKVLPFAAVIDERNLQRFHNEAQAAAHLHHTSIVPVHAVGSERGVHYYAMQFIEGRSMAQLIEELRSSKTGSSAELATITDGESHQSRRYCRAIADLGAQAAEALDHAHERGVIHRDIKPGNIMVDSRAHVWITDFGLASFERNAGLTMSGDVLGTFRYMSPEQARGRRAPIDHRTDVYSLGVTLYELLTLHSAIPGEDPQRIFQRIATHEPIAPRRRNGSIPVELETIVLKAIDKDAAGRYSTALQFAEDLRRYLRDEPIQARRPSLPARVGKWARRHKGAVRAASVGLLLAFVSLAAMSVLLSREKTRAEQALTRSDEHLELALDAMSEFTRAAGEQLAGPQLAFSRRELLGRSIEFWEKFAELAEGDPRVVLRAAAAYHKLHEIHWGLGTPDQSTAALARGIELVKDMESDEARYWYVKLVKDHCLNLILAKSNLNRDRVAESEIVSRYIRASDLALELVESAPDNPDYLALRIGVAMGRVFMRDEGEPSWDAALAWSREAHAKFPDHLEIRKLRGGMESNFGISAAGEDVEAAIDHCNEALRIWESLEQEYPNRRTHREYQWRALFVMGQAYEWADRWEEAHDALGRAAEIAQQLHDQYPAIPDFGQLKALALTNQTLDTPSATRRRAEDAIALCTPLVRDFPEENYEAYLVRGHWLLGLSMYRAGDLEGAIQRFEDAAEVRAIGGYELLFPSMFHGLALYYSDRKADAERVFKAALRAHANEHVNESGRGRLTSDLAYMLASCPIESLRDPAEAISVARALLDEGPTQARGWRNLGMAQYRAGEFRNSLQSLERGDRGVRLEFPYYRAMAHARLGEKEQALEQLHAGNKLRDELEWRSPHLEALRNEAIALVDGRALPENGEGK